MTVKAEAPITDTYNDCRDALKALVISFIRRRTMSVNPQCVMCVGKHWQHDELIDHLMSVANEAFLKAYNTWDERVPFLNYVRYKASRQLLDWLRGEIHSNHVKPDKVAVSLNETENYVPDNEHPKTALDTIHNNVSLVAELVIDLVTEHGEEFAEDTDEPWLSRVVIASQLRRFGIKVEAINQAFNELRKAFDL